MKRLISIGLVVLVATFAFAQETSKKKKQSAGGDEQSLTKIEQDWATALMKRDVAFIESVTSADWVFTTPDGQIQTRDEANADLKSGDIKFESFKIDDLKTRVYGNTAVVLGLHTDKATYKGKDISGQFRFTDTFVKRDGKWLCIATHVSKVEKK